MTNAANHDVAAKAHIVVGKPSPKPGEIRCDTQEVSTGTGGEDQFVAMVNSKQA